jgi:hypothetical protein
MIDQFNCDVIGNMDKYNVGCKLECNYMENWIWFTQPVLLQSYSGKFQLGTEAAPSTPADLAQQLMPCKEEDILRDVEHILYCKGMGKLLHMM